MITTEEKPLTLAVCKGCGFSILTKAEEVFCPDCKLHIVPSPNQCDYCRHQIVRRSNGNA